MFIIVSPCQFNFKERGYYGLEPVTLVSLAKYLSVEVPSSKRIF